MRQVERVCRLLVWDYKSEWWMRYRCRRVTSLQGLAECVRPGALPERIAFCAPGMSDRKVFDAFCRLAFVWLRVDVGTLVFEETASVTSPSKAPAAYGDILRMGLGFGCDIYALTQRPQESDKTAYGNATVLHCHQLATAGDRRYIARNFMDVSVDDLAALKPLQWIERHNDGAVRRGAVSFRKSARA